MSSESETKYSLEQLRQMNMPPKPELQINIPCPSEEQVDLLIDHQEEIIRLLKTISCKLDGLATRTEQTQTREALTAIRSMMTPSAGKKKEKRTWKWRWRLPRFYPDWGWIVLPLSFLGMLWVVWYALGVILNAASTAVP